MNLPTSRQTGRPVCCAAVLFSILLNVPSRSAAQTDPGVTGGRLQSCRVEEVTFEGWKAQQIANRWVKVIIVPQLGGRVMQVYFDSIRTCL